jgi:hypothetical protein
MSIENRDKLTKNLTPYVIILGAVVTALVIYKITKK